MNIIRDSEVYNFIIGTLSFVVLELCGFIFIYSKVVRNFPNVINLILDVSYLFAHSYFQIKKHKTPTLEEFKDIKGVIGIRKSEKDRQHNNQKKKDKQRSTKHTHKTKDWVFRKGKQFLLH